VAQSCSSLLRYAQDKVRDSHTLAEMDGSEVDAEKIVGATLRQLVVAGRSVEESRRAHARNARPDSDVVTLNAALLERVMAVHIAGVAGHIAGALQEVIIPAAYGRGEGNRPAVVVVLSDAIYHEFAAAWDHPRTLYQILSGHHSTPPSMLQQLIDVRPDKHFPLPQSFLHTKLMSRCGAGRDRALHHLHRGLSCPSQTVRSLLSQRGGRQLCRTGMFDSIACFAL
jgi:hypothetical protein